MKLHYKCIVEKIDAINYKDETEIPIFDINIDESWELELLGQVMHLLFVTKN